MKSLALTLAAFACSLSLALPPGWCCMVSPGWCCMVSPAGATAATESTAALQPAEAATVPARACCHRAKPQHRAAASHLLVTHALGRPAAVGCQHHSETPQVRCCCTRDAVVRERSPSVDDNALPAAIAVEPGLEHFPTPFVQAAPPFWSPALAIHVLQCVWRC